MLHRDLQRLLTEIDTAETDARSLVQGLTDAQGNWQPNGGTGWSVAQCLDHLAKVNHVYVAHFLPVVERAHGGQPRPFSSLRPTWFGRTFIRVLEPPVKPRVKSPKKGRPAPSIPINDALGRYLDSHASYATLVERSNHVDVNRIGTQNPFVRALRFRVATALLVVPAHDRRHLWQARQVLQAPGFPR